MSLTRPWQRKAPQSGHSRTPTQWIQATPPAADALDLPLVGRLVWTELPVLAVIDLLITLGVAVVAVVAVTVAALAPLVAAVLIGPVWLGGTAICNRILGGDAVGPRDVFIEVGRRAATGTRIALLPGVVATLLIGSLTIRSSGAASRSWMTLPIALDALILVVVVFGSLTVFPLAVLTSLSGRARWLAALALAGRHLTVSAGLLAIVVLLIVSMKLVGPFLVLVAAGPFCLLVTATVRSVLIGPGADAIPHSQDR